MPARQGGDGGCTGLDSLAEKEKVLGIVEFVENPEERHGKSLASCVVGSSVTLTQEQIPDCVKQRDERPLLTDFVEVIKKDRVLNCSVAVCAVFSCNVILLKNEGKLYNIFGNVSSGWIQQIGLKAAVFELVSSVSLDYDESKYIFFSSDSLRTAPSVQINTQVEVYEEADLTKEIIGGVIGGLLLLALITVALYKAGFFKSQYKQLIENAGQSAEDGPATEILG